MSSDEVNHDEIEADDFEQQEQLSIQMYEQMQQEEFMRKPIEVTSKDTNEEVPAAADLIQTDDFNEQEMSAA